MIIGTATLSASSVDCGDEAGWRKRSQARPPVADRGTADDRPGDRLTCLQRQADAGTLQLPAGTRTKRELGALGELLERQPSPNEVLAQRDDGAFPLRVTDQNHPGTVTSVRAAAPEPAPA